MRNSSKYQIAVALVLTRLGYSPKLEVPIFDGVVTTDIVVEMNKTGVDGEGGGEESGGGIEKVLITLDEQSQFLKPAMGSKDLVGPLDGKARLCSYLLKKIGEFNPLISIPFYEWSELEMDLEKQEMYLKNKLQSKKKILVVIDDCEIKEEEGKKEEM
jgi:hypothetical protein